MLVLFLDFSTFVGPDLRLEFRRFRLIFHDATVWLAGLVFKIGKDKSVE